MSPREPGENPVVACGHSCVCARPKGMATNGPCRCDARDLRRAAVYWAQAARYWEWKAGGGEIGEAAKMGPCMTPTEAITDSKRDETKGTK